MSYSWYLVQYLDRPERQEPRNIGLLIEGPTGQRLARFAGERSDGHIDRRRRSIRDPDAYRRWIRYIRWSFVEGGQQIEALLPVKPGSHVIVTLGGRQLHGPGNLDVSRLMNDLFDELVEPPIETVLVAQERSISFAHRTHLALREAELIGSDWWRDELTLDLSLANARYTFPGAWVNGHTTVAYHLARADDDRLAAAELRIGSIPSNFGAVVLCPDSVGEGAKQQLERLAYVASIDSTSPSDLRAMFAEPPKESVRFRETVTSS